MWIGVGDGGGKKEGRGLWVAVPGGWDGLYSRREAFLCEWKGVGRAKWRGNGGLVDGDKFDKHRNKHCWFVLVGVEFHAKWQ